MTTWIEVLCTGADRHPNHAARCLEILMNLYNVVGQLQNDPVLVELIIELTYNITGGKG